MFKYLSREEVNKLPNEVIKDLRETLKCYDEALIIFQNGKYEVTVGIGIKAKYSNDYKFIGEVRAEDIFTTSERYKNFKEVFGVNYCGTLKGYDTKVNA